MFPFSQALSTDDYREVMKIVENAILSTDLATYFKKRNSFLELVENGEFDWQSEEKKECKTQKLINLAKTNSQFLYISSIVWDDDDRL